MSLYVVSDFGTDQWLAYEDDTTTRIYAYSPNLGRFVFHRALTRDFYWGRELGWAPVEAAAARELVQAGVLGKIDRLQRRDFLNKLTEETDIRSVAEVLGAQPAQEQKPSPRRQAEAKIAIVGKAKPGQWTTYKKYPRERNHAAQVAARDLRTAKIAAVVKSGLTINSRVTETADGQLAVQITRVAQEMA